MPLIINSLGGGRTHTHKSTHTDDPHRINLRNQVHAWSKKLVKVVMGMEIKT